MRTLCCASLCLLGCLIAGCSVPVCTLQLDGVVATGHAAEMGRLGVKRYAFDDVRIDLARVDGIIVTGNDDQTVNVDALAAELARAIATHSTIATTRNAWGGMQSATLTLGSARVMMSLAPAYPGDPQRQYWYLDRGGYGFVLEQGQPKTFSISCSRPYQAETLHGAIGCGDRMFKMPLSEGELIELFGELKSRHEYRETDF